MSICDELFEMTARTDSSPKRATESLYHYLARSPDPHAAYIRNRLQIWFSKYPPDHSKDLRNRFRSADDPNHRGALFELFIHELLLGTGCKLEAHPTIENVPTTPDFLVETSTDRFFLEATTVDLQDGPVTFSRQEEDCFEKINSLTSDRFALSVTVYGKLKCSLSRQRLASHISPMLDSCDYDHAKDLYTRGGWHFLSISANRRKEIGGCAQL